ncbi:MAG: LysR family transcriptional regulator [Myxococcaceae bacterium]
MQHSPGVLSSVELLLALERHRSATAAARELETTPATVLRRLERLETQLEVRLFDRHPTGLAPTPAFALVRPWAEQAQAAAHGLLRQLSQVEQRPAGVVRLATPPAVASLFVVPALPALRRQFPELVIELVPATALVDLAQREADLALRTIKPTEGELVVQRLATYRLSVVGAKSLKPRVKGSRRPGDWDWLGWSSALAATPEARWLSGVVPDAKVVFRSSELGALIAAAQEGVGALAVADVAAERAGGLVPLPMNVPAMPEGALWLVAHQALRPVPRVAAVWDFVVAQFAARR